MKTKKALVLAGVSAHIPLLRDLRKRGYYTILVDYFKHPPARDYCDEHIQESTLDMDLVLEVAKQKQVDLVVTTNMDQANVTACYVSEKLNLPKPYSYATALNVTNKGLMKRIMVENQIPTPKHAYVTNLNEFDFNDMSFPLVVKPADSNGSKGVKRVENVQQLRSGLAEALEISRTNQGIIEEFINGVEIQIDCFVRNGSVEVLMTKERRNLYTPEGSVLQTIGSTVPAELTVKLQQQIQHIADSIAFAFKLDNTPLFIQAIIKYDDIYVLEFAPRIGGGLSNKMIEIHTGINIVHESVNSLLKSESSFEVMYPKTNLMTYLIYAKPGVFSSIAGGDELIESGVIKDFYTYKTTGMSIGADLRSSDRVGAFIVVGENQKEMEEKVKIAKKTLEVLNSDGENIMYNDF